MKRRILIDVFLLLLAAILLTGGVVLLIVRPHGSPDFLDRGLPALIWGFAGLVIVAGAAAGAAAHRLVAPIEKIDPNSPGQHVPYQELLPMIAYIRAQNRELRRRQQDLGQAKREFDAITENMSESFLLLDKRLNVVFRNVSAQHLLPTPEEGTADNLIRIGCPPEVLHAAENALLGDRSELTLPLHGRHYHIIASPVFSENSINGAVMVALDTTESEEREALRREFSANVSHELKTPLTSIAGFAELMKNGMVPPERTQEFAGDIYKEVQRSIRLVDDILKLSRLDDGEPEPEFQDVDLHDLAAEVLGELAPEAEEQGLTLEQKGESARVHGSPTALREILFNLCDNAVKYNRPQGKVTVTTRQEGTGCCLVVEDTGIGIPYEHQNRVFERFYRVDKSHSRQLGGTGLGLSIVKHAVAMHKGRLDLWSQPDVGTRITVHLPTNRES